MKKFTYALLIFILNFFSLFQPAACPLALLSLLVLIEFISYLVWNVSLGLRLAANVLSRFLIFFRSSAPRPHVYTSIPLQSGLFKFIAHRFGFAHLTFSVLIALAISYGFYFGYKLPTRFMLEQLGLLQYSALSSIVITLCSVTVIANIKEKKVKPIQVYFVIFFALSLPLISWLFADSLKELSECLAIFFAHLPFI